MFLIGQNQFSYKMSDELHNYVRFTMLRWAEINKEHTEREMTREVEHFTNVFICY